FRAKVNSDIEVTITVEQGYIAGELSCPELFSVIEDGKLTKREAMQLEFKLQHILLNSVFHICDIDDDGNDGNEIGAIHMKTIDEISTITKRILSSVVQNDMSHIHGDMMDLSISLYKTFGVEEFVLDEEEYKLSVVQNFFDIYKMAEASEDLNNQEKCEKPL
ncbi:MAG: hypothetical protein IKP63_02125, partial [Paludibacteraceae bacterium]|nr:hypothetical protein [Paludibacteraceae bacterium]